MEVSALHSNAALKPLEYAIRLLDEWEYFDRPEPRLAHVRWMRHIPFMSRILRIYHFQLGTAAG